MPKEIAWIAAILGLIIFGLIGALVYVEYKQQTGIQEGIIYDKDFNPAGCITTYISVSSGQSTTMIPSTTCHGDTYTLKIKDGEENNWFEVPQFVYEQARIGDFYSSKCDCLR